jgi:hypothetical protein
VGGRRDLGPPAIAEHRTEDIADDRERPLGGRRVDRESVDVPCAVVPEPFRTGARRGDDQLVQGIEMLGTGDRTTPDVERSQLAASFADRLILRTREP